MRTLCLVMLMMVTMGVTETSQDRADTLLRRRLTTRLRQRQTPQVTETKQNNLVMILQCFISLLSGC